MTVAGDDIVERAIEEVAIAINRYESDMLGHYMWEALDEQERGYYLDMARSVFAALPSLRAALAAAGPGQEEVMDALRPFVNFIDKFDAKPMHGLDDDIYTIHGGTEWEATISREHCRKARAVYRALASQPAKPVPVANGEKK